jgi:ABC-type polysaccharide/polyol phosphate export permease
MDFQRIFPLFQPFGLDPFCLRKKFLVFNLVNRNLKIKYRRSVLGVFWTLLAPLSVAMVYYFVFKVILNVQVPHYLAFIITGVLPWTFVAQSLMEGVESIVGAWALVSKVPIPTQVFPYVGTLTNLITLLTAVPIMIGVSIFSGVSLGYSLLTLPFFFLSLFILTYFISFSLAVGFVYFRDLRHMMTIIIQLWFYGTPVLYSENMIPAKYHWVLYVNPYALIFAGIHRILVEGKWPLPDQILGPCIWVFLITALGLGIQKYLCSGLVERI